MKIYIFGNGNINFEEFLEYYIQPIEKYVNSSETTFLLGDFRGLDTLMMEYLKAKTGKVSIYHIGERPRYLPDKFRTKVSTWQLIGGFNNDKARDEVAINECTHYLAIDKNSNEKRKSGTLKNMERCAVLNKIRIK